MQCALDNFQGNGFQHRAGSITGAEFVENIRDIIFHRAFGQENRFRDFLVRISAGNQSQNGNFAIIEGIGRFLHFPVGVKRALWRRGNRCKQGLAFCHALNGIDQIFGRCIFQQKALCAGRGRMQRKVSFVEGRQ